MLLATLAAQLRRELGERAVITEPAARRGAEGDVPISMRGAPSLVVLPSDEAGVRTAVLACRAAGLPCGAVGPGGPVTDSVLISTARMRRILEIDLPNRRAVVEPGVLSRAIGERVGPDGYRYAPDPVGEQGWSIGDLVAENGAGGHGVKQGFAVHHVTGLDVCTPDGDLVRLGGGEAAPTSGYDLTGVFAGAQGTLGIVTKVSVRLVRAPEAVATILAGFAEVAAAGAAIEAIIAAGILPTAIELMDAAAIAAAQGAVDCRYPVGAGAALIVELDGPAVEVAAEVAAVRELCAAAFEIRTEREAARRAAIWRGRTSVFAEVARIGPDWLLRDAVLPRAALPEVLLGIDRLAGAAGVRVANLCHADDGHLHPLVLFDGRQAGARARAEQVAAATLELCLAHGGAPVGTPLTSAPGGPAAASGSAADSAAGAVGNSVPGSAGVPVGIGVVDPDRAAKLPRMLRPADPQSMSLVRAAFAGEAPADPHRALPTLALCGERPGR